MPNTITITRRVFTASPAGSSAGTAPACAAPSAQGSRQMGHGLLTGKRVGIGMLLGLVLIGCASAPPTIERTFEMYAHIAERMGWPNAALAPPIFMTDEHSHFAVDGNGKGIVWLNWMYTRGELAHELCHAVQWNHGMELDESVCQEMDWLYTWRRPVWRRRR